MALFEPKMLFLGPGSHPDIPIGFGARAVSHKTSIYFMLKVIHYISHYFTTNVIFERDVFILDICYHLPPPDYLHGNYFDATAVHPQSTHVGLEGKHVHSSEFGSI